MKIILKGSVGAGGQNIDRDVRFIQLCLNRWRKTGGLPAIGVDGDVGGETIGAIKHFQTDQFGWRDPDGRFDISGNTLKNLNAFLEGPSRKLTLPVQRFRKRLRSMDMGDDGEIIVGPGDWPSRYAYLMFGDPRRYLTFYRIAGVRATPIGLPSSGPLRLGESVYEIVQFRKYCEKMNLPQPETDPVPPRILPKKEEEEIFKKILKEDYNIQGEQAQFLSQILTTISNVSSAVDVVEVVVSVVAESAILGAIGTVLGVAGIFLGVLGTAIDWTNSSNTHVLLSTFRAIAYAQTSWVFQHNSPGFSNFLRNSQASSLSPADQQQCRDEWNRVVPIIRGKLETEFRGTKADIAREAFKQKYGTTPAAMSVALMKEFEPRITSTSVRDIWILGYRDPYPA